MSNGKAVNDEPEVNLHVELDESVFKLLRANDDLRSACDRNLSQGLTDILKSLGIPGRPAVQITSAGQTPRADVEVIRVRINGRSCPYPHELLERARSYASGALPAARVDAAQSVKWLIKLFDEAGGDALSSATIAEFLDLVCREVIKRHADVLLGPEQSAFYANSLKRMLDEADMSSPGWPADPQWLLPVLRSVLKLRISIEKKEAIAAIIVGGLADGDSRERMAEDLISVLRPRVLEIQVPQEYLREITISDPEAEHDQFVALRKDLLNELGFSFPEFKFVPTDGLKPCGFAFKINDLTTMPRTGLRSKQLIVSGSPSAQGQAGLESRAVVDPVNGSESSVIDIMAADQVAGLKTWTPVKYMALCLSADLRENGKCFIDVSGARAMLGQLEQGFPALLTAIRSKLTDEEITQALRGLVAEDISIGNLRLILERALDYDYIIADLDNLCVFDERLPFVREAARLSGTSSLLAFIRSGMKRYIGFKYTKGQNTLPVHLLDGRIEKIISESLEYDTRMGVAVIDDTTRAAILSSVRNAVQSMPSGSIIPPILTQVYLRPFVREMIADEFPRLPVLSHLELPPYLNIQPVASITPDA